MSKGKGIYKLKCHICYSEDHLKKDCPKRNKKKSTGFVKKNVRHGFGMHFEGHDNGDLLMVVSEERFLEWIIDSGGSYHMKHRKDFLFDFKEFSGDTVLLGDNGACSVMRIGKVRVQMKDGLSFVLDNVHYILELNINDIFGHSGLRGLYREVTKWKSKGDQGFFDDFVRNYEGQGVEAVGGKLDRSQSTTLEKKTPMDLWSEHPTNYKMLRILGGIAYSHVNQGKLKHRAIKYIFLGDVVFNKSLMYKDTLKGAGAADSGKEVEFEVDLQGSRVEPTVDPHTGENPGNEDEKQDEGPQQQNLDNYVLVRDRVKRTTTIRARYRDEGNVSLSRQSGSRVVDNMAAYAFAIVEEEDTHKPITFQKAINSSKKDEWVRAMEEEMSSLKKNHTWELVDQPPGPKLVSYKWLYKIKEGIEGIQKPRYKARLVARGFTQRAWIDYNEVFSPVVRHTSIRVILSLTAYEDYKLEQLDVKLAWFNRSNYDSCVYFKEFAPGLVYGKDQRKHMDVDAFVDADYAKDPNKEAQYMVLTEAVKESIWLKGLLIVLEIVESKEIEVEKIGTEDNAANAFTKVVPGLKFKYCMKILLRFNKLGKIMACSHIS
nr:retrovirus-related Pol polyprotein from transposon TNT 1-94 [Tanacetum cinerariifolium]